MTKRKFAEDELGSEDFGQQEEDDRSSSSPLKKVRRAKKEKKKRFQPDKLLVLDLNGVLIHRRQFSSSDYILRPHALEFVKRMSMHYVLAIWSSAKKDTVKKLTKKIFQPEKFCRSRFLFIWNQDHCDMVKDGEDVHGEQRQPEILDKATRFYGDSKKPVMLKNLSKVIDSFPQFKRKVILIDNDSYKTVENTPASVFNIPSYSPKDEIESAEDDDMELEESSELCKRLEVLAHNEGDLY